MLLFPQHNSRQRIFMVHDFRFLLISLKVPKTKIFGLLLVASISPNFKRQITKMFTYVLLCEDSKIYVGKSQDINRRLRQHWKGKGALWTRLFPPIRVLEIRPNDVEVATTIEYFKQHGMRVRGGPWCQVRLKALPQKIWEEEMATTLATATDISNFTIQPPVKNAHNSLIWSITVSADSKSHPKIQCGQDANSLRVPFGLSKFSETSRTTLDYSLGPFQSDILAFWQRIDEWILEYVWKHQSEFFKKPYATKTLLTDNYCPIVSQRDEFEPLLRTKINEKSCPVFVIDENGSRKGSASDIQGGSTGVPVVQLNSLWVMSNRFGASVSTAGLMLWPRKEKTMTDMFHTDIAFSTPMDICQ